MRKHQSLTLLLAIMTGMILSSCGTHESNVPGYWMVANKSAKMRTEGGGIVDTSYGIGRHQIAPAFVNAEAIRIRYTPRRLVLDNFPVVMKNANNQQMVFDITLIYRAVNAPNIVKNFKNFPSAFERILRETSFAFLSSKHIGIRVDDAQVSFTNGKKRTKDDEPKNDFSNRTKLSKDLTQTFRENFKHQYGEFYEDFEIIGCFVGNMDYPPKVLAATEKAVAKAYETHVLAIEEDIARVKGQVMLKETQALNDAVTTEARSIGQEFINFRALQLLKMAIKDPEIETDLYLEVDEYGNFTILNPKSR